MTTKFRFVWIDDNVSRASGYIGGLDGILRNAPVETELEVIPVTEELVQVVDQRVGAWKANPPDLIIVDQDFSTIPRRVFDMHGSALAHLLRIQLSNTPIVCVSGQLLNSDQFNIEDLSEYTYLFDVNKLNTVNNLELLLAIAKDFSKLCFPSKQPIRQLMINALNPPIVDQPVLSKILPDEFEGTFQHGTSPHRIARWILTVLMRYPGFLYDALETATFLGLTEAAFLAKARPHFERAQYSGPFATESNPMWWASALTDVLYELLPDVVAISPQEAGRQLSGIVESDFSRCAVTTEHTPPPDVVAYTDATKSERRPVQHRYTIPESEEASSLLGFSTRLRIRKDR